MRGALVAIRIVRGLAGPIASGTRIRSAAKAIEEYLGGRPDKVIRNSNGDFVIMRGDKKIRFDIFNPGRKKPPHFHIERKPSGPNSDWEDVGQHYYPFKKD